MRIGDLELHLVSDGRFRLDGGMMFGVVPRVLWEKRMTPDASNRVPLQLNCLLVRGPGFVALVDTGLGTNLTEKERDRIWGLEPGPRLLDNLATLAVAPEEVTLVLNTHLHVDHAGGNTVNRDGRQVPTFPNARYVVQRREWDDAMRPNERTKTSCLPEILLPVAEAGALDLIDGEAEINPYIQCLPTPGHTTGHQSILFSAGGERILHLGDVAPFAAHCERLAWVPAIDILPLETMESKHSLLERAVRENHLLIFYHELEVSAARLERNGDNYRLVPEPFD